MAESTSSHMNATATTIASPVKIRKILYIMDESGSMSSMGVEPIQSINDFIKEQKCISSTSLDDPEVTFTLFKFSNDVICSIDDISLSEVEEFTHYIPNGMTALYDAIGKSIDHMKTKPSFNNVVCVILTDGAENASKTYNQSNVKSLIKEMEEEYNWTFIYVGANQDSYKNGGCVGVTQCANFSTLPGGLLEITRAISDGICRRRSGFHDQILSNIGKDDDCIFTIPSLKKDDGVSSSPSTPPRTPTHAPRFM
jgi:hypothetical protein